MTLQDNTFQSSPGGGFGAGFMPGGSQGDTPSKKNRSNQALLPLTIKQMMDAEAQEDGFTIDGREVTQVTLVGLIIATKEQSTTQSYTVDDGTGNIEVRYFVDSTESESAKQMRNSWREGVYVRVFGSLRSFKETKSISAFNIRVVEDFNEITYHLVEAIQAHLHNTVGSSSSDAVKTDVKMEDTNTWPGEKAAAPTPFENGMNNFDGPTKAVLEIIQQHEQNSPTPDDDAGADIRMIISKLQGQFSEAQIRQAVDQLSQDGNLYSTIDEDHFKLTMSM